MAHNTIVVRGARVNNLKNISLDIPHHTLVVFTGLSGSGKSSLAFDTIYGEGQRRFMESLSSFTKQFLENVEKPDVDHIEGLPPTIAIDQRSASSSPRSTVGTATEIYDALRLLFSRAGQPHCPSCHAPVHALSRQQIINEVNRLLEDVKGSLSLCARMQIGTAIDRSRILDELEKLAIRAIRYQRQSVSLSHIVTHHIPLDESPFIDVIIDTFSRPKRDHADGSRVITSVCRALEFGDGTLFLWAPNLSEEHLLTTRLRCHSCNRDIEKSEPRHFSFNNPVGACTVCAGLGYLLQFDTNLLIPNQKLTVAQGAIQPFSKLFAHTQGLMESLARLMEAQGSSINTPIEAMSTQQRQALFYGKKSLFPGIIPFLQEKYHHSDSDYIRSELEEYMRTQTCSACNGKRLKQDALAVQFAHCTIDQLVSLPIDRLMCLFKEWESEKKSSFFDARTRTIAQPIMKEILKRAESLSRVGLPYLTLDRSMQTLSGGEAQRVKLSAHISTSLVGVVYVLDEPSIGLHPRDTDALMSILKALQQLGNTVIVVEHDKQIIRAADTIVDIGPGAGKQGGSIVAVGPPQTIMKSKVSITGQYLSGSKIISLPKKRKLKKNGFLEIIGAREHNLKNLTVRIPTGALIAVTGVSGSGKSTLVIDILSKALMKRFYKSKDIPGNHDEIRGLEHIDKAIVIDQTPIGRTPRSNPVTYTNIFTPIRELFTNLPESKIRGFTPGHFSFNVKGGRCETCQGEGMVHIDMRFLSDVYVECHDCEGKRYTPNALEVHFEGHSIADVLDLTVSEACEVFKKIPAIYDRLEVLRRVGLGYIRLGQPAPTLSGGEAQRIKLAAELSRRSTGHTLTILDEPTTGLHFEDIQQLLSVLDALVEKGNTVLMIEHNLDVIKNADWVLDLGPEGGEAGGSLIAEGTPEDIAKSPQSVTGKYLASY